MISIAEIFENSKELLDSISGFVDKYIGTELLRKCHISKVVNNVQERGIYDYHDNPLLRLISNIKESRFLEKSISAKQLLTDKLPLCFSSYSAYQMFKTDTFYDQLTKILTPDDSFVKGIV